MCLNLHVPIQHIRRRRTVSVRNNSNTENRMSFQFFSRNELFCLSKCCENQNIIRLSYTSYNLAFQSTVCIVVNILHIVPVVQFFVPMLYCNYNSPHYLLCLMFCFQCRTKQFAAMGNREQNRTYTFTHLQVHSHWKM